MHVLPSVESKKEERGQSHLGQGLTAKLWQDAEGTRCSVFWHCEPSLGKTGKHRWEILKNMIFLLLP